MPLKFARPLVIGMIIGIPLGYYFLQNTESSLLMRGAGARAHPDRFQ